jgi:tyrosyl-tRNA synthetase
MLAGEIPYTRMHAGELADTVEVLVATDLAKSNGDARRTMEQNAYAVNGVRITAKDQLSDQKPLHGRYLLLRRGKKLHHLVEIIS